MIKAGTSDNTDKSDNSYKFGNTESADKPGKTEHTDPPDNADKKICRKRKKKENESDPFLELKIAANRVSKLLCEISLDTSLFISDAETATPQKRLDTKSLKEFSAVIKEMSGVLTELYADRMSNCGVRIEFSDEAFSLGA